MTTKTSKTQQGTTRTGAEKVDWARPRVITVQGRSASFGYPSPKPAYIPPTEAERMAEDVERWDGLS